MVTLGAWAHCKVDADVAPIQVGDLLTTSATRGHAQRAEDRGAAVGAIVGRPWRRWRRGAASSRCSWGCSDETRRVVGPGTEEEMSVHDRVTARLTELREELRLGEAQLRELLQKENALRETLLRISGAVQVLEEVLGADSRGFRRGGGVLDGVAPARGGSG